ncbi:hypothetical protein [Corallococcus exiguus]|uniref:hypothetical protein n=1 Tax=Corallococcus exiguus TaxID=83462 RepID=UPI001C1309C7|nr:hypothetical protein [Corallococcus exiguus]
MPAIKKQVLYLDQFFFSSAFRAGDERFLEAAGLIAKLTSLQLLVVPYSSIHEEETNQWKKRDELLQFIKATARGVEFEPAYEVEHTQLVKAFRAWLAGELAPYRLEPSDALSDGIHGWDSYLRIDVSKYVSNIDLIRDLKRQSTEALVDLFDKWRGSKASFEDDLKAEYAAAGKTYMDSYLQYVMRIARGDHAAMLDAPINSMAVQSMLQVIPSEIPADQRLGKCFEFLLSDHFKETPCQWINAHMFVTLKMMVKEGAYTKREKALKRLGGFFFDTKHIATYAPYVDAFVMDQPMAELVTRPTMALEPRYNMKVFNLNNWGDLLAWLEGIEAAGMTGEHRAALAVAYPRLQV